jgi:hypothetical protein
MNKTLLLLSLACLAIVGCGKKEEVVITGADGTKVTASEDGSNVSVTDDKGNTSTVNTDKEGNVSMSDGKGGTMNMGTGSVSEADLGAPFYPGSTEGGLGMSATVDSGDNKVTTCVRTTKDDPTKVLEFYQSKVMNPTQASGNAGPMKTASISGKLDSGADISIACTKDGDKDTNVIVTVTSKKK